MNLFVSATVVFFLTYFGLKLFLGWSRRRKILDIPNERSSHRIPTPIGGGLVIVTVCLLSVFVYGILDGDKIPLYYYLGAILVAGISWLDDLFGVPVVIRFAVHSLAALILIWGVGIGSDFSLPYLGTLPIGKILYFFWIVWLINAYNFMDGIDGIAGAQAVTAGLSWAVCGLFLGVESVTVLGLIIAVSAIAFLMFNWQPARIFMGDVGSAFLGYTFAAFPVLLYSKIAGSSEFYLTLGVLFVWLFVYDTFRTLIKRLLKREYFWKAHRSHIYQELTIHGYTHQAVTSIYAILSVIVSVASIQIIFLSEQNKLLLLAVVLIISLLISIFNFYNIKKFS